MAGGNFALPKCAPLPVDEYQSTAATFDPTAYDPREWARLAREAGAEYAVLTAKHHDGYAMFRTGLSDFSIKGSGLDRDIVGEFVEAFRNADLRVGLYFSLADWHHPDYPPFTDADRPYIPPNWPRPTPEQWGRYTEFLFGQVRELLTNYGRIDLLWFDGQWERTPDQWRAAELGAMARKLQPYIVINDRLPGAGDYDTPEQFVPSVAPERPWEVCLTMNDSWGYNPPDTSYKSSQNLVRRSGVAGKGGRLLNLSPRGDGTLAPVQVDARGRRLAESKWDIHCTQPGLEPWQFYGLNTERQRRLPSAYGLRESNHARRPDPARHGGPAPPPATRSSSPRAAALDQLLNSDPMGG
jgi:alpha-L-fucosidase